MKATIVLSCVGHRGHATPKRLFRGGRLA